VTSLKSAQNKLEKKLAMISRQHQFEHKILTVIYDNAQTIHCGVAAMGDCKQRGTRFCPWLNGFQQSGRFHIIWPVTLPDCDGCMERGTGWNGHFQLLKIRTALIKFVCWLSMTRIWINFGKEPTRPVNRKT
jgi:hypothetical protein